MLHNKPTMTLKMARGLALFLFVAVGLTVRAEPSADIVSPEYAAEQAAATFGRLTGFAAEGLETTTRLVYQPDAEAALERGELEFLPSDYLVVLTGQLFRKAQKVYYVSHQELPEGVLETINEVAEEYEDNFQSISMTELEQGAGLAEGTLKRLRQAHWVYEQGIVGRARVDADSGRCNGLMRFRRALPHLNTVAMDEVQASEIVLAEGAAGVGEQRLVEPAPFLFVWCCTSGAVEHYVDARTGAYLSQDDMLLVVQEILEARALMDQDGGGLQFSTMHPVFVEQGMHQDQHEQGLWNLCGPTAVSILLDYFGEMIHHLDVATVSTEPGETTQQSELEHAGMFSHNSDSEYTHGSNPVHYPLEGGYTEREYGYTACRGKLDDHPWDGLAELIDERCPFIAHVPGHYITVIGYAIDGDDKWVGVCDPADDDEEWAEKSWRGWTSFNSGWSASPRYNRIFVIRPIPVEMEFLPNNPQSGQFKIQATVRTCHEFPEAEGSNWIIINRYRELKGNSAGSSENLPVTITYPQNVTKVSGSDTQYFNPSGRDDEDTFSWVFTANGNEKGGEFKVEVTGWAVDYNTTLYTHQTDELFGWGVIRIDDHLFRIKDANGDTVAAIGDQGNLYLAGTVYEWQDPDDVEPDDNVQEVVIKNGDLDNVAALFEDDGDFYTESLCHGGMDDLHDGCDTVNGNNCEQDYLDNPPDSAFMIKDGDGNVVAYISAGPTTLTDPNHPPYGTVQVGGDLRLKGMIFDDWDDFDYWD